MLDTLWIYYLEGIVFTSDYKWFSDNLIVICSSAQADVNNSDCCAIRIHIHSEKAVFCSLILSSH